MKKLALIIGLVIVTSFPLTVLAQPYVVTGISDIQRFLDQCPTNDPAYDQIRQD